VVQTKGLKLTEEIIQSVFPGFVHFLLQIVTPAIIQLLSKKYWSVKKKKMVKLFMKTI